MVVLRCWWLCLLGATVVVAAATVVVSSGVGASHARPEAHEVWVLGVRFSLVTLPARVARVDLVRAARTKLDGVAAGFRSR